MEFPIADAVLFRGVVWRRFCAFVLDSGLIIVFGFILAIGIGLFGILTLGLGFLLLHIVPLVPLIYYTALLPTGGTAGQRLFGISVRQDADLALPNYAQAVVWSLLLAVSYFAFCLPFLLALMGPRHRAGHDIFSGLVMIRLA